MSLEVEEFLLLIMLYELLRIYHVMFRPLYWIVEIEKCLCFSGVFSWGRAFFYLACFCFVMTFTCWS